MNNHKETLKQIVDDLEALENISRAKFDEYKAACQKITIDVFNARQALKEHVEYTERLEEALRFYADGYYEEGGGVRGDFDTDWGQIAQQALSGKGRDDD